MTCLEPPTPEVPDTVAPDEKLGRCVFSTSHFRASSQTVRFGAFLENVGNKAISVDRLTLAPVLDAVHNGEVLGWKRGRTFHGWAILKAPDAQSDGRSLMADPLIDDLINPYHANIMLPESTTADAQKHHAQQLASVSVWRSSLTLTVGK